MTRINKRKKVFKLKLPFMFLCAFGIFVIGIFTYSFGNLRFEKTIDIVSGALHKLSGSNRIIYNSLGGSTCSDGSYTPGSPFSGLCQPTLSGYTFAGWRDDDNSTYFNGQIAQEKGDLALTAMWEPTGTSYKCKRATLLHTALCNSASSIGCRKQGLTTTSTITYGKLSTSNGFEFGDAYDCDVDGDGIYDPITERFYYITDLEGHSDVAVLLYYNNVKTGVANSNTAYKWFTSNAQTSGPATAAAQLPTTEQWPNISLQYPVRDILDNSGAVKKSEFDYSLYSARLLTYQELLNGSGDSPLTTVGNFDNYSFLLENTQYDLASGSSKYGYWLETGNTSNALVYNVDGRNRDVMTIAETNTSYGVRPAIEVLKSEINNTFNTTISVTYHSNGGSDCEGKNILFNSKVGELCEPTRIGYAFAGWYDENGNLYNEDTVYTGITDLHLIAHWRANTVCRRATTLSTATCSSNSSYGCRKQGMASGATITYGDGTISDHLITGNPLICDVNGDNIFDETLERFYYVTDLEDNSDVAVLIASDNVTGGVFGSTTLYKYFTSNNQTNGPVTALAQLPTTTQWPNIRLSNSIRNIVSDNGTLKKEGFSYEGYAARLLTFDEVNRGCGITLKNTVGILDNCSFLLENTQYQASSGKANNYWLETATSANTTSFWYIQGTNRYGNYQTASSTAAIRPAIEVSKDRIDLDPVLYITYDNNGGTGCDHKLYQSGAVVGELCIPYRDNYTFTGWHDSKGDLVSTDSVFTCNNDDYSGCTQTLTASWEKMLKVNRSWEYDYTGDIQTFNAPLSGLYRLEVRGGKGGGGENGGYSVGYVLLSQSDKLYIAVGGNGVSCKIGASSTGCNNNTIDGGYNGGGKGRNTLLASGGGICGSSGAGATHIAKVSGTLAEIGYEEFVTNGRGLIVAGGSGGSGIYGGWTGSDYAWESRSYAGGAGGGLTAGGGSRGGTQDSGYAFGEGQPGGYANPGGGGGLYGGLYGASGSVGGGGGSGYIGGVLPITFKGIVYSPITKNNISSVGKASITLVDLN